jgi:hypothetical protein
MNPFIEATALEETERFFELLPGNSDKAMSLAINRTASRSAVKLARDQMYKEVNFPNGYLNKDRLEVSRYANPNSLEAALTGRDRPTSLARFSTSKVGQKGVTVQVQKGSTRVMKRGFLVKLRGRKDEAGQTYNEGLAIRLAPGEKIENKYKGITSAKLGENVYLLYGPSVDQVFRGVADDIAPEVADDVTTEFFRQLARLTNG